MQFMNENEMQKSSTRLIIEYMPFSHQGSYLSYSGILDFFEVKFIYNMQWKILLELHITTKTN
jgi:hypothetical protein